MTFKRGDRVIYTPWKGCSDTIKERGIVKRMSEDGKHAFVLYHTALKTYEEHDLDFYTSQRTDLEYLTLEESNRD